jgi:hypothetical protein
MIYLSTATGLSRGGSSTHLHTNNTQNDTKQSIHRTAQQLESAGRAPFWLVIPWHLPYNRGKTRKTLSQVSRCPVFRGTISD